jgi:hypothetical protein
MHAGFHVGHRAAWSTRRTNPDAPNVGGISADAARRSRGHLEPARCAPLRPSGGANWVGTGAGLLHSLLGRSAKGGEEVLFRKAPIADAAEEAVVLADGSGGLADVPVPGGWCHWEGPWKGLDVQKLDRGRSAVHLVVDYLEANDVLPLGTAGNLLEEAVY